MSSCRADRDPMRRLDELYRDAEAAARAADVGRVEQIAGMADAVIAELTTRGTALPAEALQQVRARHAAVVEALRTERDRVADELRRVRAGRQALRGYRRAPRAGGAGATLREA